MKDAIPPELIELAPEDWLWVTYRKRTPLSRPAPLPFDQNERVARLKQLAKQKALWQWPDRVEIPVALSPEEAHFWFVALSGMAFKQQQYTFRYMKVEALFKEVLDDLHCEGFDGHVSLARVSEVLHACANVPPKLILPLYQLLPFEALVELIIAGGKPRASGWQPHFHLEAPFDQLAVGLRRYLLPYLTEAEVGWLQSQLRPALDPGRWPANPYEPPPVAFRLAACLGLHQEIYDLVKSWPDDLYQGRDRPDRCHRPQEIVFGLGSAELVEIHMRRLKLRLKTPAYARAWLAHTGALDKLYEDIVTEPAPSVMKALLKVLGLIKTPLVARYMLELMLTSPAPQVARQWLDHHPEQAIAGLAPLAVERGKLAETALYYLTRLKQQGHEALIKAYLTQASPDLSPRLRAKIIEDTTLDYRSLDAQTTPAWLQEGLSTGKRRRRKGLAWADPLLLPPLVIGQERLNNQQVAAFLEQLRQLEPGQPPPPVISQLKAQAKPQSLASFAWRLFQLWGFEGMPPREQWIFLTLGFLGDDHLALKLASLIRSWDKKMRRRWAASALESLWLIGSETALLQISDFARHDGSILVRLKAGEIIEQVAAQRQLSPEQFEDCLGSGCGLDETGSRLFDFGPRQFWAVLGPDLKPLIRDAAGKTRTTLPPPGPRDEPELAGKAAADWRLMRRQLQQVIRIQSARLEEALADGRRWPVSEFERLWVRHPLLGSLARTLLWGGYRSAGKLVIPFRIGEAQTYSNDHEEVVSLEGIDQVGLVHPLELTPAARLAWSELFSDYKLIPPFTQLGRDCYPLAEAELHGTGLRHFAGLEVRRFLLITGLAKRGWRHLSHVNTDLFLRQFRDRGNVTAVLQGSGTSSNFRLMSCFFVPGTSSIEPDSDRGLLLGEVEPIAISETIRDLVITTRKGFNHDRS